MLNQHAKQPIDLKKFANNLPAGITQNPAAGRLVFGSRWADTLPYLVQPGADAAVKPEDVSGLSVYTEAFVRLFDLSDPEHLSAYESILDAVASGWFRCIYSYRHWDTEKKNMRVYIEYVARHRVISKQSTHDSLLDQFITRNKSQPIQ